MTIREFVFAIIAAIIVSGVWTLILILREKWEKRPLKKLFSFGDRNLTFVVPIQRFPVSKDSLSPQGSIIDFLVVHIVTGLLSEIDRTGNPTPRDPSSLVPSDKEGNLITIGSSKNNTFTGEVLDEVKNTRNLDIFYFERIEGQDKWQIRDNSAIIPSPAYDQIENYLRQNKTLADIYAEQEIEDVAIIAKVINPWNPTKKVFIIAGVRGIGTWGAAEYLRKNWKDIYNHKRGWPGYKKDGEFAAVLNIKYCNWNVVGCISAFKDFS
ncbi:MAG: hypothetical protein ACUZ77_10135 [Candidatus Brocadiales bacterium]